MDVRENRMEGVRDYLKRKERKAKLAHELSVALVPSWNAYSNSRERVVVANLLPTDLHDSFQSYPYQLCPPNI